MANQKKMVEEITSMEEDFAKWYTDIVKKAELMDYSSVRGCMIIEPYGYALLVTLPYKRAKCALKMVTLANFSSRNRVSH